MTALAPHLDREVLATSGNDGKDAGIKGLRGELVRETEEGDILKKPPRISSRIQSEMRVHCRASPGKTGMTFWIRVRRAVLTASHDWPVWRVSWRRTATSVGLASTTAGRQRSSTTR